MATMMTTLPVAEALRAFLHYVSREPGVYECTARRGDSLYAHKAGEELHLWVRGELAELNLSGNEAYGNASTLAVDAKWKIAPYSYAEEDES